MSDARPRPEPDLRAVYAARARIQGLARRTPLLRAEALERELGTELWLKLESLQPTGAFKVRGAANALARLSAPARAAGVVAVSTGNHGRAVAYVARCLGIPATVCISRRVPAGKQEALRALGCRVVVEGESQDEAEVRARALQADEGLTLVHPFDDADVIAGQGTVGLELLEDLPGLGTVLVPLSGGGLAAGVALAVKTAAPTARVVGVTMERGAAMAESLARGRPVPVPEVDSLADSLQGGIGEGNRYTFALVRRLLDDVVRVSEDAIGRAMAWGFERERLVLEGAAAVGLAALREGVVAPGGGPVVALCSGRNVDPDAFLRVLRAYGAGAGG